MKFPSHEWLKTCSLIKYNDNHSPIRLYTNLCPFYWTQTFIRWFHRTFATDVDADRKRLLLRTPGLAYIYVLLVTSDTLHGRRNRGWGGAGGPDPSTFQRCKKNQWWKCTWMMQIECTIWIFLENFPTHFARLFNHKTTIQKSILLN